MLHVLNVTTVWTARCCVLLVMDGGHCRNAPCPERDYLLDCTVLCIASDGGRAL